MSEIVPANGTSPPQAVLARRSLLTLPESSAISLGRLVLVGVAALLWQLAANRHLINPLFFGSPAGILTSLWDGLVVSRALLPHLAWTVTATLAAFALGSVSGIACGLLFAIYPAMGRFADPFIMAFNALPRVALAPLFILWFGLGLASKIAVGISLCFVILLSSTVAGARSVDPDLQTLGRTLGVGGTQGFFLITLPSAIPTIFSGLRLGLIYALLGVVSAEIIGSVNGIGVELSQFAGTFDTNGVFAVLVILAVLGSLATWVMSLIENRLLRWR